MAPLPSFDIAYYRAVVEVLRDIAQGASDYPPRTGFEARSDGNNQRFAVIPAGSGNPKGFHHDAHKSRELVFVARVAKGLADGTLVLIAKDGARFIFPRSDFEAAG